MKIETMEEPEYVVVAGSLDEDAERIELPTEHDNTLGLQTLIGAFPGAHGLKYKNPATGAFRALLIDNAGAKFHPPPDGWLNKVFIVLSQLQQSAPEKNTTKNQIKKSDQNAKRRKLMVESDDADSCDSDAEPVGKSGGPEMSVKRQQGATKQKRMMGNTNNEGKDIDEEEEELPTKMVDLLVLGLPFELTEDVLRTHFETFGKVVHCEVKTQKGSSANRGFGFVQMGDLEAQQKVLKQKMHVIGGRECHVKIPFTKNALSSKVFVGRIKEGTTTVELRTFFEEEAHLIDSESTVTDVYIPRPFRSFAFVTFSSPAVAKEMIKKAQFTLGETSIYVSSAHSTRPHANQQDGNSQLQQFQQHRSNSFQMSTTNQHRPPLPTQNLYTTEEVFYNEWYGQERKGGNVVNLPNAPSRIHPSRIAGQMFVGTTYQHQNHPPPPLPPPQYAGTPPAAAAGNQMLNQLETLNLNNIGIGPEVANAIKAILSVAQTATSQQQQVVQKAPYGNQQMMPPQPQLFTPYQSLSPPPNKSGSSPNRVYVPPHSQSSHHHYQGRRNGGGGESGSNSGGGGNGWH